MYPKKLSALTLLQVTALSFLLFFAVSCGEDIDPQGQLLAEVTAVDSYLDDNNLGHLTLYDPTGIRMVIYQIGDQAPPGAGKTVKFDYAVRLFSTGEIIETGTINDKWENMPTEGLKYALSAMLGNSIGTFYVPSQLAYGETGKTGVPPNSTLVYELQSYLEVTRTSAQDTQFAKDTTAIRQYLNANGIRNATKLSSGVWYVIEAPGTGESPTPYDYINFQFTGTVISNGYIFGDGSLPSSGDRITPFGLVDGLKLGLPSMRDGGIATFYIPSVLAYGATGQTGIPANANLIFKITLNSIDPYFH